MTVSLPRPPGARAAPATEDPTGHIAYVDGLRAIAVLGTVAHHLLVERRDLFGHTPLGDAAATLFKMGAHGVDLFFVLSGFCLAYPTLVRLRAGDGLRFDLVAFAAKRVVRIVPPYYAAIVFAAVLYAVTGMADPGALAAGQIAKQVLFLDTHVRYLNGAFWTLPIELRWYAVFPFALAFYARTPRTFGAATVAALVVAHFTYASSVDLEILPLFLAGIWVADLHVRGVRAGRIALAVAVPAIAIAVAVEPPLGTQFYAIEPIGMVAAIACVVAAGALAPLRGALAWRPLVVTGWASYSIYLVNLPVIRVVSRAGGSPLFATFVALAVAFVFYVAIERPIVRGPRRERVLTWLVASFATLATWLQAPRTIGVAAADVPRVERIGGPARGERP